MAIRAGQRRFPGTSPSVPVHRNLFRCGTNMARLRGVRSSAWGRVRGVPECQSARRATPCHIADALGPRTSTTPTTHVLSAQGSCRLLGPKGCCSSASANPVNDDEAGGDRNGHAHQEAPSGTWQRVVDPPGSRVGVPAVPNRPGAEPDRDEGDHPKHAQSCRHSDCELPGAVLIVAALHHAQHTERRRA